MPCLKRLKKDVLVESAYNFSLANSKDSEEFSRVFDSKDPHRSDDGYYRVREKWVHLINTNKFPNRNTRDLIFDACPEAEIIYKSQFWDVLADHKLTKFQLLKIMKSFPLKYLRALRLETKNIRKKHIGFNLPSNLMVKSIYVDYTVDAFAACFALFRYELNHSFPCSIIYQQYESYSLKIFIALMAQEPFYIFKHHFIEYLKNKVMSDLKNGNVDSIFARYTHEQLENTIRLLNKNIKTLKFEQKLKCKNDIRMFLHWWFEANPLICQLEVSNLSKNSVYAPPKLKGNNWILEQMNKQRSLSRQISLLPY